MDLSEFRSLAAEIYDSRNPVFSRSSKLHRPRGPICSVGLCPNCMMRVDGIPNTRACQIEARDSHDVEAQNVFPLVDHLNLLSHLHRFLRVGFQYRVMYSSRRKSRLFFSVLKRSSGLGEAVSEARPPKPKLVKSEPDLLVIGGGVAGIAAALEASKSYDKVLLVDSFKWLGGEFAARWQHSKIPELDAQVRTMSEMVGSLRADPKVSVLLGTRIVGYYQPEGVFVGVSGTATSEIKASDVIVATGSHEVLPVFSNNDSPRVMLSLGAQLMLNSGASLGRSAAILDLNGTGVFVAADLKSRGLPIRVVSAPRDLTDHEKALASRYELPILEKSFAVDASNSGVTLLTEASPGRASPFHKVRADVIVVCGRYQPNYEIGSMLGCTTSYLDGDDVVPAERPTAPTDPGTMPPPANVVVVGSLTRAQSFDECLADGSGRGREVRARRFLNREIIARVAADEYLARAMESIPREAFVCLCEDVTFGEVIDTIRSGYNNVESLKRFTGAVTGPCQGKQSALTVASILFATGESLSRESLFTTARQPVVSVPFSQLVVDQ